jgi:hypothetical protein
VPETLLSVGPCVLIQTSASTWASSYCACCASQLSALPPNTLDSLRAISGEMPPLALTSSESVVRVAPRAAGSSVMLKPKGSMHWRKKAARRRLCACRPPVLLAAPKPGKMVLV